MFFLFLFFDCVSLHFFWSKNKIKNKIITSQKNKGSKNQKQDKKNNNKKSKSIKKKNSKKKPKRKEASKVYLLRLRDGSKNDCFFKEMVQEIVQQLRQKNKKLNPEGRTPPFRRLTDGIKNLNKRILQVSPWVTGRLTKTQFTSRPENMARSVVVYVQMCSVQRSNEILSNRQCTSHARRCTFTIFLLTKLKNLTIVFRTPEKVGLHPPLVEGLNPAPHIHEQKTTSNYGYDTAYTFTQNNITLEHNAMNNKNTITHMDAHNTQY